MPANRDIERICKRVDRLAIALGEIRHRQTVLLATKSELPAGGDSGWLDHQLAEAEALITATHAEMNTLRMFVAAMRRRMETQKEQAILNPPPRMRAWVKTQLRRTSA